MNNKTIFLLLFTAVGTSCQYNAMSSTASQHYKQFPHPIPYTQHNFIPIIGVTASTINRQRWEQQEYEIRNTITDENIRYSFNIWCKRLKAHAHNSAQKEKNPQAFLKAPEESPSLILAQLLFGKRPYIQNPKKSI